MKTIILIRHGEAESDATLNDKRRPLSVKGKQDIAVIAAHLRDKAYQPQLIVSSPALRALMSAEIVCEQLNLPATIIQQDDRVYQNTLENLLDLLTDIPANIDILLLTGHNPGFSAIANYLTNASDFNLCAGGLCIFTIDEDQWRHLQVGTGKCVFKINP